MYFNSWSFGKLSKKETFEKILEQINNNPHDEFVISVGTDSQTYGKTKIVTVIAIHKVGKGGNFFYYTEYIDRLIDIRQKIYTETQRSIDLGKELTEFLFNNDRFFQIIIHVDMGESKKGKTYNLINGIMSWIAAEGFEGAYKPDSSTASEIADRLSK